MRAVEDVVFEVDYWKSVTADVAELNELVVTAARELVEVAPALLLVLAVAREPLVGDPITRASGAATAAMTALAEMSDIISRLGDLIGGRSEVLSQELRRGDEL